MELAARLDLDRLHNHCPGRRLWRGRLRKHDGGLSGVIKRHDRPVGSVSAQAPRHALFGRGLLAVRLLGAQRQIVSA